MNLFGLPIDDSWIVFFLLCSPIAWLFLMSVPSAAKAGSWKRFFSNMLRSALAVVLPLPVFLFAGIVGPDWKGQCGFGWLDCVVLNQHRLWPLVLWAFTAFWWSEVHRRARPVAPWVGYGLWQGALVAGTLSVAGGLTLWDTANDTMAFLWVPLVLAGWYGVLAYRRFPWSRWTLRGAVWHLLAALPWWVWTIHQSRTTYAALPDEPPQGCFVVTAAQQAPGALVGPRFPVQRGERQRWATRQLATFWQLEAEWHHRSPGTHRGFRRIYNRFGPALARRIRGPGTAGLVWLLLKPAEWGARGWLHRVAPAAKAARVPHDLT